MDNRTVAQLREDRALLDHVTVTKLHEANRRMHVMLNEAGVPECLAGDGVRTCIEARVAWLVAHRGDQQGG